MAKYYALPLTTKYWKPGTDSVNEIVAAVAKRAKNGDFVVVSEKALSTASGRILDENHFEPSLTAKVLAKYWMPFAWGYPLGVACHFGQRLLKRLRKYPTGTGCRHKQAALQYTGFLQTLMFGSEGGIDGSNLPYSLVSLPLENASFLAEEINREIWRNLRKKVAVMIVDTDKTYTFRNFHFTPRPNPLKGINPSGGVVGFVIGRLLKFKRRPTPLAVSGCALGAETALIISNVADRARGPGSGATVWDMAARFKVDATGVSWGMLMEIKHKPIVIVRSQKAGGKS